MVSSARTPRSPGAASRKASSSSGRRPKALDLFGDKAQAKALAKQCGVPVIEGTSGPTSLDEARAFLESLGAAAPS
jgi:biotin carboxylase